MVHLAVVAVLFLAVGSGVLSSPASAPDPAGQLLFQDGAGENADVPSAVGPALCMDENGRQIDCNVLAPALEPVLATVPTTAVLPTPPSSKQLSRRERRKQQKEQDGKKSSENDSEEEEGKSAEQKRRGGRRRGGKDKDEQAGGRRQGKKGRDEDSQGKQKPQMDNILGSLFGKKDDKDNGKNDDMFSKIQQYMTMKKTRTTTTTEAAPQQE